MRIQIVLAVVIMFSLVGASHVSAQGASRASQSPWDYPAEIRDPTPHEYQGMRERFSRAMNYRREQNWSAAAPLLRENLAVESRTYGPSHPVTGMAMFALAGTVESQGQYDEAEELMFDAIRIAHTWLPEDDAWYALANNILGMCQGANSKWDLAEASFRRAIQIAEAAGDERAERIARANLAETARLRVQR